MELTTEVEAIKYLDRQVVIHVLEASDANVYETNTWLHEAFDCSMIGSKAGNRADRIWEFRAVGNRHIGDYWRDIVDTLEQPPSTD